MPPSNLRPVDPARIRFTGGFWADRIGLVRDVTVPALLRRLDEEGWLETLAFDRAPAPLVRPVQASGLSMQHFFDSDIGKWIEAASLAMLAGGRDGRLEERIDAIAERYAAGQMPDGYLNSWFIRREPGRRWTNLRDWHEMYSLGHLVEGAVAYTRATGKRRLLEVVSRAVDHAIATFGPLPSQRRGYDAHAEMELAMVRLHDLTGDPRHLAFARYLVDERGRMPSYFDEEARARGQDPADYHYKTYAYSQAHKPVREQAEVVGHAVRATYLYAAMADLARADGDAALAAACGRLFDRLVSRQLYVTGGIGPSADNEGFTREYDLPNATAYAETCAAIGLGLFAHRLDSLALHGRHADIVETVLFNGALAGLSADGEHFFYDNVLESAGQHRRWRWHYCPCCATNIARFMAGAGQFVCSAGSDTVAVHQYASCEADLDVGGRPVRLVQATDYPWDGTVRLRLVPDTPRRVALLLRVPGWSRSATLTVDGQAVDAGPLTQDGYCRIDRHWSGGEEVVLRLAMLVERLHAHPAVAADAGRQALRRGPVVYCVEECDVGMDPRRIRLPADAALGPRFDPDLPGGGAVVVEGTALAAVDEDWSGLYRTEPTRLATCALRAVPYYLWANRAEGAMAVWLPQA
ncbi:beta-L-arabinofuranosidase domain-containing protein [uncultured Alsobacter sp.]|uniref:glycoside hydrolase family 127 protein n=1 Tax=uncultured Alsobacter sp. TaxID=1748258 RepID=UPI0025F43CB6|nr:beta-L-arabinofuranosidase domain-containing protein [uncultured Alsobacter sp.]